MTPVQTAESNSIQVKLRDFALIKKILKGDKDSFAKLMTHYKNRIFVVCANGEKIMPPIQFVHQLQHLLFGLGLNSEMEV